MENVKLAWRAILITADGQSTRGSGCCPPLERTIAVPQFRAVSVYTATALQYAYSDQSIDTLLVLYHRMAACGAPNQVFYSCASFRRARLAHRRLPVPHMMSEAGFATPDEDGPDRFSHAKTICPILCVVHI